MLSGDTGVVDCVMPRKNQLLRPALANVDLLIAVVAVKNPAPDLRIVDKLLVNAASAGIPAAVCINKMDLGSSDIAEIYSDSGCSVIPLSAASGEGMVTLTSLLGGRISVLAGNSGVGKTSILNRLGFSLETGSISKILRGRHTTRHTELYPLPPHLFETGYIADTPGFSVLCSSVDRDLPVASYFPEFTGHTGCKFDNCVHLPSSSGCEVVEAVKNGEINSSRYNSYLCILKEIEDNNRRR